MATELRDQIEVAGIPVEVRRKRIKNLHIGVYPPDGRVRVSAPIHFDHEAIRLSLVSRLGWIRRKRESFRTQPRESEREMVRGESHYLQGKRYRLDVVEVPGGRHSVSVSGNDRLLLQVQPGTDRAGRLRALHRYYRAFLQERIPELLAEWEPRMGVQTSEWRVKHMKTRWGSCNIAARRIWLNLELAKKSDRCLEYVVVHELTHLLERNHTERFRSLMDEFLPDWRARRDELNTSPLGHEEWGY